MQTDDQFAETLGEEFHSLVAGLSPRTDLADRVVGRDRSRRRRTRTVGVGAAGAVVAGSLAVTLGGLGVTHAPGLEHRDLRLASYHFSLPRDTTAVAATPADCALKATVASPDLSAVNGVTKPAQPAVASAVLGDGGCVSMLLTAPYAAGDPNAPKPAFPVLHQTPVSINGDAGTVGTYEFIGSASNGQGTALNGAKNVELALNIPAGDGREQLLLVAAAGISEQQLESIVASGLQGDGSGAQPRR
ncbi:MAG: hypothetical protein ACR2NR_15410 [Solirubrobacteraceae bacterium]